MIPSPGLYGSPSAANKRYSSSETLLSKADYWTTPDGEDPPLSQFCAPWEPEQRDTANYWNYENDCFRVDRKPVENNEFCVSPDNFFTPDSWREREELKKRQYAPAISPNDSFEGLQVQGRSVGKDEDENELSDDFNKERTPRSQQPGKLCGTQNYYKLDPAECDSDYASLCILGRKADARSDGDEDEHMSTSIVVDGEREFLFSFGKCGRVAVLTPITEVPSQCATPFRITVTPSSSEHSLTPVISYGSLYDCTFVDNAYTAHDPYLEQFVTPRRNIPYEFEICAPAQQQAPSVYENYGRIRKSLSEAVATDPLVDQLKRLSVLPERTRAAYNLPAVPVSDFGVPALSVSSATISNRYHIKKIADRPINRFAYRSLPPLYPTAHLEDGANKRLSMGRSRSMDGFMPNAPNSSETSYASIRSSSCKSKDKTKTNNKSSKGMTRRRSSPDSNDSNTKLPPLYRSMRKNAKNDKKASAQQQVAKKRKRKKKVIVIDPSPWIQDSEHLDIASDLETMVGEKTTHSFGDVEQKERGVEVWKKESEMVQKEPEVQVGQKESEVMQNEPETEDELQSSSWSHTVHSERFQIDCPYMSQSLSKESVKKKTKRKRMFRNRKKKCI